MRAELRRPGKTVSEVWEFCCCEQGHEMRDPRGQDIVTKRADREAGWRRWMFRVSQGVAQKARTLDQSLDTSLGPLEPMELR